jgi:thiamine biosynthesis lipoprotein
LQTYDHAFRAMGTACALRLLSSDPQAVARASEAAVAEVARLELKYSRYRGDSLLSAINHAAAAGGEISLDDETVGLLDYAFACHQQSGGLFDITSGVLRRAWDFKLARRPEAGEIERLLPLVGLQKLDWRAPVLRFPQAGMEIDFGGIVKEYAADRAAAACRALGLSHGLVDLGGDISVIGPQPDGSAWPVGSRHPHRPDQAMAVLALRSGGLASSGDYERFFEIDGVRYSHILDPRTGWPVRGLAAVSVAAESCLVAGSLCTIAMLKQDEGPAWLQSLSIRSVWMDSAGRQGECASAP